MVQISDLNQTANVCSLTTICINQWEINSADFGLSTVYAHLESIRNFIKNLPMYRRNAQAVITDNRIDELLEDSFRYENHHICLVLEIFVRFDINSHLIHLNKLQNGVPHEILMGKQRISSIGLRPSHKT